MPIKILIVFIFLSSYVYGQNCPDFQKYMIAGNNYLKRGGDYLDKALQEFLLAQAAAYECRISSDLADAGIKKVFTEIKKQRDSAKIAQKNAEDMRDSLLKESLLRKRETARADSLTTLLAASYASNHSSQPSETTTPSIISLPENANWLNSLSSYDSNTLRNYIVKLNKSGKATLADTIIACFSLLDEAKTDKSTFNNLLGNNFSNIRNANDLQDLNTSFSFYGYGVLDILYYWGLEKATEAGNVYPSTADPKYKLILDSFYDLLKQDRKSLKENYWFPDTLLNLHDDNLYALASSNNKNFMWGYSDYSDYRKLKMRFLNLSLQNFSLVTDSTIILKNNGNAYEILAADGNNGYKITKTIDYSIRKSKVEYQSFLYTDQIKLEDGTGRVLDNLSDYSSSAYFFSVDGNFFTTWKDNSDLFLYDVKKLKFVLLPNSRNAITESMSSDSKQIAYWNKNTNVIYFADMSGAVQNQIPVSSYIEDTIQNIDFTGNDKFLKINTADKTYLFDINAKKLVLNFYSNLVNNIVVSPDKNKILITCNSVTSGDNNNPYTDYVTFVLDSSLNVKDKLYSDCDKFLFTPDGRYIIAYDKTHIMRWDVNKPAANNGNFFNSSLSFDELSDKSCIPFNYYLTSNDAVQIEKGARIEKDIAEKQDNPILKNAYYNQSKILFDRLTQVDTKNLRKERLPFFYDWSNWLSNKLGYKNFNEQLIMQQKAVKVFDSLLNSPDSVYSEQLFYAANGNMLVANLYDSLQRFTPTMIEQIKKEIVIREKAFYKDAANSDNVYYFTTAFQRLSAVYDTLGLHYLLNSQFQERLSLYKAETQYLFPKFNSLPDSFDVKTAYINSLAQLAPTYLYTYVNAQQQNQSTLDSVLFYVNEGLALKPEKFDSARFLVAEARYFLLQDDGLEKALAIYNRVLKYFPELTKDTMLLQLSRLKAAGAITPNISKAADFLNKQN